MALHTAFWSFSQTLERVLDHGYSVYALAHPERNEPKVDFKAVSAAWLASGTAIGNTPVVGIYLYRITPSAHARNSRTSHAPGALSLDLHYLISVWTASEEAETEQRLMGWTMDYLHCHAAFDSSVLTEIGGWGANEMVTIYPEEITMEECTRIFESVRRPARLSWAFGARVVRIESPKETMDGPPVLARRHDFNLQPVEQP